MYSGLKGLGLYSIAAAIAASMMSLSFLNARRGGADHSGTRYSTHGGARARKRWKVRRASGRL